MAARRPQRPTNEQGRLITEEEKANREWRRKNDPELATVIVMTAFTVVAYPFVMIARGAKKVWSML